MGPSPRRPCPSHILYLLLSLRWMWCLYMLFFARKVAAQLLTADKPKDLNPLMWHLDTPTHIHPIFIGKDMNTRSMFHTKPPPQNINVEDAWALLKLLCERCCDSCGPGVIEMVFQLKWSKRIQTAAVHGANEEPDCSAGRASVCICEITHTHTHAADPRVGTSREPRRRRRSGSNVMAASGH